MQYTIFENIKVEAARNQLEFDFNVLVPQNNRQSEAILFDNEKIFKGQCKTLYDALKRGERLTTGGALINYRIGDLRRRIKDLRDAGVEVKDKLIEGRFKEYFL